MEEQRIAVIVFCNWNFQPPILEEFLLSHILFMLMFQTNAKFFGSICSIKLDKVTHIAIAPEAEVFYKELLQKKLVLGQPKG